MFSGTGSIVLRRLQSTGFTARRAFASLSKDAVTGLNMLKKGSDPAIKPDTEYPEWLWALAEPEKTLSELRRVEEDSLTMGEIKRYIKLENRDNIRKLNHDKAK